MKNKHYEMIMAKAANMDLVVFLKNDQGWSEKENQSDIQFHEYFDYFLCLPQHKELCLHWLNGGALSSSTHGFEHSLNSEKWGRAFRLNHPMLQVNYEFKIVPKKEKRWIPVKIRTGEVGLMHNSYESCQQAYKFDCWQIIEIEVEV